MKYNLDKLLVEGIKIHGKKYNYNKVKYINWKTKVDILCNRCSIIFKQSPQQHINRKHGCKLCNSKKLSKEEIINRCNLSHNNRYTYPKNIEYSGYYKNINIICNIHGVFSLTAKKHINDKVGCEKCKSVENEEIKKRKESQFIKRSISIHGNLYTYDNVVYQRVNSPVLISCKKHGDFLQLPASHLRGCGCNKCSHLKSKIRYKSNLSEFIIKANKKHNNRYIYKKSVYISANNIIEITCRKHGDFYQLVSNHLSGSGCPTCKLSKGELAIFDFLKYKRIKHKKQKTFNSCVSHKNNKLKFDFYLPELNTCIEYDGEFHYLEIFGSEKLKRQIKLDNIKNEFCKNNNIKLIRIPYWKLKNIDDILLNSLDI